MIKHIQTISVFAVPDQQAEKGYHIELIPQRFTYFMDDCDVKISEQEVVVYVDVPDEQGMLLKAIETLREKQKQVLAESQQRVDKLQAHIDRLMMLEYKPVETAETA